MSSLPTKPKTSQKINPKADRITMPIGVACWLITNTSLTFRQIANFCGMHVMDISAIENGNFGKNVSPYSPLGKYLTQEEIDRAQKDENIDLKMMESILDKLQIKKPKTKQYVPLLQRRNRLDGAFWVLSLHPYVSDAQIAKLVKSTTKTISSIRGKTYRGLQNLIPKDPVITGICSQKQLDLILEKSKKQTKQE